LADLVRVAVGVYDHVGQLHGRLQIEVELCAWPIGTQRHFARHGFRVANADDAHGEITRCVHLQNKLSLSIGHGDMSVVIDQIHLHRGQWLARAFFLYRAVNLVRHFFSLEGASVDEEHAEQELAE
jgi:hypothetical protein